MATAQGITPLTNLLFSRKATQDPTTYGVNIDAAIQALSREAGKFVPMTWPGAYGTTLSCLVGPGHYYDGTNLNEMGSRTTGNTTNSNGTISSVNNTVGISIGMMVLVFSFNALTFTATTANGNASLTSPSSTSGLYVGMPIYGAGVPAGTTITAIGASVTMSQQATANASGVTILATGFAPCVPFNTIVTGVTSSSITISQNATATVTGAFIFVCQPVGTRTTGDTHNGTAIVDNMASTAGIFKGMNITGTNIPASTTVLSVSPTSITLSQNCTGSTAAVVLTVTIPVPGSNSRFDWLTINQTTGLVNWVQGTPSATPAVPALPSGELPCGMLLVASSTTSIGTNEMADVRDLSSVGMKSGAFAVSSAIPTIMLAIQMGANL